MAQMKAMVWTKYGPPEVLQLQEVEKPAPKENEVLIKIHATSVFAGDCEVRAMKLPLWLRLPLRLYAGAIRPHRITILGQELAGVVEAVGGAVTRFKPGDAVFGASNLLTGTYAEYVCLSQDGALAPKPANLSYTEAATVPVGGLNALHFLRKGGIQPEHRVLIIGAGGSIGVFGVQLARHFGAEVTAVDRAEKLDMLRALGASTVIDYTREDFTRRSEHYDVIFDVVGKGSLARNMRLLKDGGRYLLANPSPSKMAQGRWFLSRNGKQVIFDQAEETSDDLVVLKELIEAGRITTVIDRRYPLEQLVEAHRYVDTGMKAGNVAITVIAESG